MTIGREEVGNPAGQNAEKPRQSKNKCSSAWKGFEASHMHSVHFPMDKVGYTSEIPRSRKDVDSWPLPCSGEKPRARSRSTRLPSFQVVRRSSGWRRWLCSEWYRPSEDRCWPGVESQGRTQVQLALQRSADFPWLGKETNRKRTGEWNGKDLPTMCDKNVPAKTLPPSAFRFGCARWRVERSHDVLTKAPFDRQRDRWLSVIGDVGRGSARRYLRTLRINFTAVKKWRELSREVYS